MPILTNLSQGSSCVPFGLVWRRWASDVALDSRGHCVIIAWWQLAQSKSVGNAFFFVEFDYFVEDGVEDFGWKVVDVGHYKLPDNS
jgi:hypothetical protein